MSKWIRGALSASFILLGAFLLFHAGKVWFLSQWFYLARGFLRELQKLPFWVGVSLGFLFAGAFLLRGSEMEISMMRGRVLSIVLVFFGLLLIFDAYNTWLTYCNIFYMKGEMLNPPRYFREWAESVYLQHQMLPLFLVVGLSMILIGVSKVTKPEELEIREWKRAALSGISIVSSVFLIFYAYYQWIGHYMNRFLRLPLGLYPLVLPEAWFVGPLDLWLPFYMAVGFISIAFGLVITLDTQIPELAKAMSAGSLTVFGEFMIFYGYHILVIYVDMSLGTIGFAHSPWIDWLSIYFVAGFASFAFGLILTYRALKTQLSRSAKGILSAIFLITGSFLIFDAYWLSVRYHEAIGATGRFYKNFAGLQAAYKWLPLYITVGLISLASGLIIAYKTLRTPDTTLTLSQTSLKGGCPRLRETITCNSACPSVLIQPHT